MAGMSMKEIARIIEFIEPQGVQVTRTKKGLLLRLPDGNTEMLHFTTSDNRAYANTRAKLRRAGITMPADRHSAKLPEYVVAGAMRPTTLDRARRKLDELGNPTRITASEFMAAGGAPSYALANRTLYHLGWLPHTDQKRAHKIWLAPVDNDPEPIVADDEENGEYADMAEGSGVSQQVVEFMRTRGGVASRPEIRFALPDLNMRQVGNALTYLRKSGTIERAEGGAGWRLVDMSDIEQPSTNGSALNGDGAVHDVHDAHEPQHLLDARDTAFHVVTGTREFIDSVNSWTLDVDQTPKDISVDALLSMLRATGLGVEIRVWHLNEYDASNDR